MARAAKVPKVAQEFGVARASCDGIEVIGLGGRLVALTGNHTDAENIAAALNLWMAIERGELIVKEAE